MILDNINGLAVIAAGILYFVLGALWYSPLLFAAPFIKYRGLKPEEMNGAPIDYLMTLVGALIVALVLAIFVNALGAATFVDGVGVGLLAALGVAAPSTLTYNTFSGPHKMLWLIFTGYQGVAFALMGVILALWR